MVVVCVVCAAVEVEEAVDPTEVEVGGLTELVTVLPTVEVAEVVTVVNTEVVLEEVEAAVVTVEAEELVKGLAD